MFVPPSVVPFPEIEDIVELKAQDVNLYIFHILECRNAKPYVFPGPSSINFVILKIKTR